MHKFSAKTLLHCSILLYNCVNAMHLYMVRVTQFHTHKHMCKLHGCSHIIVCVCVCMCVCVFDVLVQWDYMCRVMRKSDCATCQQ